MWYAGDGPSAIEIGYASSPDGIIWTKSGNAPVFVGQRSWDGGATSTPVVIKTGGTFVLYFSGHPGSYSYSLGRATSPNGINWTEDPGNPLMVPEFSWEESRVHPTGLEVGPSGYELYYTGGFNAPQIGRATSTDGRTWIKDASNPIVPLGAPGSWDDAGVAVAKVVRVGGVVRLYYGGERAAWSWRIGFADYSPGANPPRYPSFGYFVSQIVDSGSRNTTWNSLEWSGSVPAGTGLGVTIRVGNTSRPDSTWSPLRVPITTPGLSRLALPTARFGQLGVVLAASNQSRTPTLDQVSLTYSPPGSASLQPFFGFGIVAFILVGAIIAPVAVVLLVALLVGVRRRPAMASSPYPAYLPCFACGAANPMSNRFCSNCGRPIGGPPG